MKLQVTLKDLVDLIAQIEKDEQQLVTTLRRRDRDIGKKFSSLKKYPLAQLSAWLDEVNNQEVLSVGSRVDSAMRIGMCFLLFVGIFLGWLTSKAVFSYDGSTPVSVIDALFILVFLQVIILLFTCVTFLPNGILKFIPFVSSVKEAFSLFSPGNLLRAFFRILPSGYKDSLNTFYGALKAHRSLYGEVEKWTILRASQVFAVSFNLGALIGFYLLIASEFVAFGWSTTLGVNSAMLKTVTDFLSWPWSKVLAYAQPTLELIDATRFSPYVGKLDIPSKTSPEIMGTWWSFIFLSILIYGLLPRILTLTYSFVTLRKFYKHTFLNLPGAKSILDRMNTPLVEPSPGGPKEPIPPLDGDDGPEPPISEFQGRSILAIDWGGTGLNSEDLNAWLKNPLGADLNFYEEAGGSFSTDHDQRVLVSVNSSSPKDIVLIVVKAWEPPMADFKDFIKDLRKQIDKEQHVVVLPVGLSSSTEPLGPEERDYKVWSAEVKRLGDPWTTTVQREIYGKCND